MRSTFMALILIITLMSFSSCRLNNEIKNNNLEMNDKARDQINENLEKEETIEIDQQELNDKENKNQKILIAYFTWADNTHVENPETVDVDVRTSASLLPPGNTGKLAQWIKEKTGGDIFKIQTVTEYSSDYDTCLDQAADEKAENARPSLVKNVQNVQKYDVVFLGYPNWWYTTPMAVRTFIDEHDLTGKIIVSFCAHGTGGLANSIHDIEEQLPETTVLEPIGVYRPDIDTAQGRINEWVENLPLEF